MAILLLLLMIVFIGVVVLMTYTVYIDQNVTPEYKLDMYSYYASLVVAATVIGILSWVVINNGG
jgi:hypothetical protein